MKFAVPLRNIVALLAFVTGAFAMGGTATTAGDANKSQAKPPGHVVGSRVEGLPVPEKGTTVLDGLYMTVFSSGGSLVKIFYFFTPAGYLSMSPFGGIDRFDFAAAAKKQPSTTGAYSIQGNKLIARFANNKTLQISYAVTKEGIELDGFYAFKAEPYKSGAVLDGKYSGSIAVGGGGQTAVASARTYLFKKDGTYELETAGAATLPTKNGQETIGGSGKQKGTYKLSGNTLELKASDGKLTRHTIFPYENYSRQIELNIDGMFCKPIR